ncbi:hypothetical protein Slin14017_G086290 [Septoria linicola]|nr:hypothetical protein Slin14017_G086290 [Septoria linicola]
MKASAAAAILAFCANSAVAAPVQAGSNKATDAEKREAEPFLNNLIPDFSKANPNDDSPFNPFDDPGLPGKAKREAEPFLSGLIPDFSKANPNDDSPFNPFDDPGLPGKAKREALINPATGMRAFNSFQKLANLPEKIGDIFKRDPEMYKREPEAFLDALSDAVSGFGGIPGVQAGKIILGKVTKREASPEPFLDALSDAVSGFGGIPGVQAGKIILDKVTKRDGTLSARKAEALAVLLEEE